MSCLCNNFSMKLSIIWKSNQGLSPSLPGSAGWELLYHSHIQWQPVIQGRLANSDNCSNLIQKSDTGLLVSRRDSDCNFGMFVKAEVRDKYCSHLGLLTYLGGQVFLRHLFGLPTLGNQLPHIHVNLCGYCIVDKLNIAGVRLLYQEFGGFWEPALPSYDWVPQSLDPALPCLSSFLSEILLRVERCQKRVFQMRCDMTEF